MRWKTILRLGIIIYTFLMITIECRTNIMAISALKDNTIQEIKTLEEVPFYHKTNKMIKVFMGDFDKGKLICKEYALTDALNETDEVVLTRLLKRQFGEKEDYILGIPNDAHIENIELNLEENLVLINMSQSYQLTNNGCLGEYLALQSLVTTVMHYYNVQEAVISVDGKPYCSGHFCFEAIHKIIVD